MLRRVDYVYMQGPRAAVCTRPLRVCIRCICCTHLSAAREMLLCARSRLSRAALAASPGAAPALRRAFADAAPAGFVTAAQVRLPQPRAPAHTAHT